jgi:outer membrane biosynthesis protein TonB
MTETQTPNENPADILLTLIVALLAPMFLTASGSDINLARLAAFETVNAYRARSHTDLIAIAQIIGCGLIALGSLGFSMADDLSLSMVLRLRGNAVALNRVADQNRRALTASQAATPNAVAPIPPPDPAYEATVQTNVAAARKLTAEAMANLRKPEPDPATAAPPAVPVQPEPKPVPTAAPPAPPTAQSPTAQSPTAQSPTAQSPTAQSPISQREWQVMLASAMTDVAAEFTADVANLPPEQRAAASRRAALLSSAATDVILGNIPPPMKPGDLAAFMQSNANGK